MALTEAQKNQFRAMRAAMDGGVTLAAEAGTAAVKAGVSMIRPWKPGA